MPRGNPCNSARIAALLILSPLAACGADGGTTADAGVAADATDVSEVGSLGPTADAPSDAYEAGDAASIDAAVPTRIEAWIYPGSPACNAAAEYSDGRHVDVLKPQYYSVAAGGALTQQTVATDGCNGFSTANAADVKAHSTKQLVTVSGGGTPLDALATSASSRAAAVSTLTEFVAQVGFSGVDIDFEGISSAATYAGYLSFLTELGTALHQQNLTLEICAPPIANTTDQGQIPFHYEDIAPLPVDAVEVMAYDYMIGDSPNGAGDPIAPNAWVSDVVAWTFAKMGDPSRVVVGVPSYGYHGVTGAFTVTDTTDVRRDLGARRLRHGDPLAGSFEMSWASSGTSYVYVSASGLDQERALIASKGAVAISVWFLGGNPWFTTP